jgi:hypothetical protein
MNALDPSGLQILPRGPMGIMYLAPNKEPNTVVAGKEGLEIQIGSNPNLNKFRKENKEKIIQILKDHEQIHIDDLTKINKTPTLDLLGKRVEPGTVVTFSDPVEKARSEVKATLDTVKKLQALRDKESNACEKAMFQQYIDELNEYARKNAEFINDQEKKKKEKEKK